MNKAQYSIDQSLNKTIIELILYSEIQNFNGLYYYNYAIELPITPCSQRIESSVSGKY